MVDKQTIIEVKVDELVDKAVLMKGQGYRLVQISCTYKENFEITYSFDKDYELVHYRIHVERDEEILSISQIFFSAFIYENELKDLFGVKIKDIAIDYEGGLYRVAKKAPFAPQNKEEEEAKHV
ncbi:MAG: NADH-quinone oxidoreductase subunit C [Clostridiaceae bacterium]|nr:NADH-quinone oxidoreductase subunit C [Clostridiaceae bacterium]